MPRANGLSGKPLQFLGGVLLGWTVVRLLMIFPLPLDAEESTDLPERPPQVLAPNPVQNADNTLVPDGTLLAFAPRPASTHPSSTPHFLTAPTLPAPPFVNSLARVDDTSTFRAEPSQSARADAPQFASIPLAGASGGAPTRRWSGSFWLFARSNSETADLARVGQLGGSQAGGRIEHRISSALGLGIYARVTAALARPVSPEAAIGMTWHAPTHDLPFSLGAERRIALGAGGRDATALIGATGFGPSPIIAAFTLEAYGQAGLVGLRRHDAFADGRITLAHPIAQTHISLGFSVAGGAQPGVERLDIGPRFDLRLPLGRTSPRLSLEWRERIAGDAQPGSGLALTIANDF